MAAMRRRNLLILMAITVVVVIAAIIVSLSRAPQSGREKPLLFPELKDNINQAEEVVIKGRGRTVTLLKQDGQWRVRQAGGYPAKFEKIKNLLVNMASVRVVAEKTSNPSLYPRLGVEDPEGQGAASHLVELKDNADQTLVSLIVGKDRKSSSPMDAPAVYVRQPDEEQSLLVEGQLPVSTQITDWFDQQLFSVKPRRIESVTIRHPDEEEIVLSRPESGDDFTVKPLPNGRKPQSEVILTRTKTVLENVFATNVTAAEGFTFPDDHTVTTVRTFDGLVATIRSTSRDGRNYVAFDFSVDGSRLPEETGEDTDENDAGATDKPDVREEAAQNNDVVSGWVFTLPQHRYEILVRDIDDLTRPE